MHMSLKMAIRRSFFVAPVLVLLLSLAMPQTASAQFGGGPVNEAKFTAAFIPEQDDQPPRVLITATIQKDWYVYSVTQKKGGPVPTVISLKESDDYELTGKFTTTAKITEHSEDFWPGLVIEKHYGTVVWVAPIKFSDGVDPKAVTINGTVEGQVCSKATCKQFENKLSAAYDADAKVPAAEEDSDPDEK